MVVKILSSYLNTSLSRRHLNNIFKYRKIYLDKYKFTKFCYSANYFTVNREYLISYVLVVIIKTYIRAK